MFVILVEYRRPLSEIKDHVDAHRAHLGRHYEAGNLLMTGRLEPVTGGIILAVGTRIDIDRIVAEDPFVIEALADYTVFEFNPNRVADDLREIVRRHGIEI